MINHILILIITLSFSHLTFGQTVEKSNQIIETPMSIQQDNKNTQYESVRIEEPQSLFSSMKLKPIDLDVKFFSFASTTEKQNSKGGAAYDSYNYFGIQQKLTDSSKFGLRIPFLYSTLGLDKSGRQVESRSSLSDVILFYSENNVYDLPFLSGSGSLKLYLPTSDFSRAMKTYGQIRGELYNSYNFSKYSKLTYALKPEYHFQSQVVYLDPQVVKNEFGEFTSDPRRQNTQAKLEHYIEASFDFNKSVSIAPAVGFYEEWKYASKAEQLDGIHNRFSKQSIGLKLRPFSGWSFTLGREVKTKLTNLNGKAIRYNDPADTTLFLMTDGTLK